MTALSYDDILAGRGSDYNAFPPSSAQERLWFLHRLDPSDPAYHMCGAVRFEGPIDLVRLARTVEALGERHEALRTVFREIDGRPIQLVSPTLLARLDTRAPADDDLAAMVSAEAQRPFDLAAAPVRFTCIPLGARDTVLIVTIHHIVSDGLSVDILAREFAALYGGASLDALPLQFADFALWERARLAEGAFDGDLLWWREALAGVPTSLGLQSRGCGVHPFAIPDDARRTTQRLATSEATTPFVVALAAFARILGAYLGRTEFIIGIPAAGRPFCEVEGVVGLFVNTLPLPIRLSPHGSLRETTRDLRDTVTGALSHAGVPFDQIVDAVAARRHDGETPLVQALLTWRPGEGLAGLTIPGAVASMVPVEIVAPKFDIALELIETENGLSARLEFAKLAPDVAARLAGDLIEILAADADATSSIVCAPTTELSLVSEPPRAQDGPLDATERAIAAVWEEVLGIPVGRNDNFFALGGHSLLGARVLTRIRARTSVDLRLRAIFEAPTVAQLAALVRQADKAPANILPKAGPGPVVLSSAQERLWFLDRLQSGQAVYNIPIAVRLDGPLDIAALTASLTEIKTRHNSLRTRIVARDGAALQEIDPPDAMALPQVDLGDLPEPAREAELWRRLSEEAATPFDLASGPLLRATLFVIEPHRHVLAVTLHHIIADGWSLGVMVREIAELYRRIAEDKPAPLPDLPLQYVDYAVWQRHRLTGSDMKRQLSYWRERLAGAPTALDLPADHPRPALPSFRGARCAVAIPEALTRRLSELSQGEGATLFMLLAAAFQALLSRWSGQKDVIVGTPVANRNHDGFEELVGLFVNTLPLRTDFSGDPRFRDLLKQVREKVIEDFAHQELPFEKLVDELRPVRDVGRHPFFQVMFVLQNAPLELGDLSGVRLTPMDVANGTAKFDLLLSLTEASDGLSGWLEYSTDLFEHATIARLADYFHVLLEGIAERPDRRVSMLPLLTENERRCQLSEWNRTDVSFPTACLHDLFSRQAVRCPDAIAVACDDNSLTYGELETRANRLAHHLRGLGVGPEAVVGVCVERSVDLVVALLGVLKAGGAYLPLDPSYPAERLAYLVTDAAAAVIVSTEALTRRLPAGAATIVQLDTDRPTIDTCPSWPPQAGTVPENLAYIIYTSGSTGQPKGVMNTHAAVTRLFAACGSWLDFRDDDVWTLFHSFAFDFSVWELWGALLHGGRVVVVPFWVSRSADLFYELLSREGVTVLNQTPSAFQQLIAIDRAVRRELSLRWVIFGGEALNFGELRPWFERHGYERPQLVNMYGITETTVHVTYRFIEQADVDRAVSNIGRPLADLQAYVLDDNMELLPIGAPGELFIGGAGLARGYCARPALAAERFVPNPFVLGERLYRTGDLARYRPDGNLEFLGRLDHQVKIRGFRIELGEIEAALSQLPGIREAAVSARSEANGDKRLVAYFVTDGEALAVDAIAHALRQQLPDYMVPAAFVQLPRLPLTTNGKLDRAALPPPEQARPALAVAFAAPRSSLEETVARVWARVLDLESVGVHDNFFDLGGHSLAMVRVQATLEQELGRSIPIIEMFRHATISELSDYLANGAQTVVPDRRELDIRLQLAQRNRDQRQRLRDR